MAKTATISEQNPLSSTPANGRWVWRDDSNTLEYISNNADHRQDRRRDRGRQNKPVGIHFQDQYNPKRPQDRGATPMGSRAQGFGRGNTTQGMSRNKSGRQNANRPSGDHSHVTLEDVKGVAYSMMSEVEMVAESFEGLFGAGQFDQFLVCLLNYFHWFFEKRAEELKPNPMNIEPSLKEIKYYEDLCVELDAAQKILGQSYCILVLGIGLEQQHHMACGASRVSSTYKDRDMYETLYSYCSYVVWIAFKRKEFEIVRAELGRMLRSDTFNPSLRVKHAPESDAQDEESNKDGEDGREKKLTPAEYRRLQGKRPAIKSIINQRSPALVSILPSPKEESKWLFKRGGALNKKHDQEDDEDQDLEVDFNKLKVGIVGESLSLFNPQTLTPMGADNEEEENGDGEKHSRRESQAPSSLKPHSRGDESGAGHSRGQTGASQVTTEALSDDDE